MILRAGHLPLGGLAVFAQWLAARPLGQRMIIAAAAGALAVLAMPPFGLWPVLFLSCPVLVWLLDGADEAPRTRFGGWRPAAATAWAFGLGYFLTGLHWIGSAFLVEADMFAWMIPFVAVILPGGLALFFAAAAVAGRALAREGPARVLAFVIALAGAEWLRGHVLTGFPWNAPGYAFGVSDALLQGAALWGLYGHTLVVLLVATAPALLAGPGCHRRRPLLAAALMAGAGIPLALWVFGAVRLAGPMPDDVDTVRLRIVQPNIAQTEKWRPELRAVHFSKLLRMSREEGLAATTHVIWPESAPPFLLGETPDALTLIADMLPAGTTLVTGAVRGETLPAARADGRLARYFNAVMVIDAEGTIGPVYDKQHLVPFGEYLPLQGILERLGFVQLTRQRGGFDAGSGPRTLDIPGAPPAAPLVCYEIIFPGSLIESPAGAARPGWLLNVTNDAWFGDSIGPRQHLAAARMRAVEEGLPVVRAANTGISAVIDARGRILRSLALNTDGVLDSPLPGALPPPLHAWTGDRVFALMLVLAAAALFWLMQPDARNTS